MKIRLAPFVFLLASLLCFSCAEEVVPSSEDYQEPAEATIDNDKSTDGEEGTDPGEDPDDILPDN